MLILLAGAHSQLHLPFLARGQGLRDALSCLLLRGSCSLWESLMEQKARSLTFLL